MATGNNEMELDAASALGALEMRCKSAAAVDAKRAAWLLSAMLRVARSMYTIPVMNPPSSKSMA
jgi:hypothetical protein